VRWQEAAFNVLKQAQQPLFFINLYQMIMQCAIKVESESGILLPHSKDGIAVGKNTI